MITDKYGLLLSELSQIISIPLKPDKHNTCLIHFAKDNLDIQIEIDPSEEFLLIGTNIAEIPPGRYRQDLFQQALQANILDKPRGGILAFSKNANKLVLFLKLPLQDLNGLAIAAVLPAFIEKSGHWKEGIKNNQVPPLAGYTTFQASGSGMFGLSP